MKMAEVEPMILVGIFDLWRAAHSPAATADTKSRGLASVHAAKSRVDEQPVDADREMTA